MAAAIVLLVIFGMLIGILIGFAVAKNKYCKKSKKLIKKQRIKRVQ